MSAVHLSHRQRGLAIALLIAMASCQAPAPEQRTPGAVPEPICSAAQGCSDADNAAGSLSEARSWAIWAARQRTDRAAIAPWARCAATAYEAMDATQLAVAREAASLAEQCTDGFLEAALEGPPRRWTEGRTHVGGLDVTLEFRSLSRNLVGPLSLTRARDVPATAFDGQRFANSGFGVPLVVASPRCDDRPVCRLLPPEGVFRWATAWVESDPGGSGTMPRLVIADPLAATPLVVGKRRYTLAADTSAFYARGLEVSDSRRVSIFGLLGGDEVGKRAGLYLLEDYDPNKRPVVMIHGLGSSPQAWSRLTNALWGAPDLRARFQVWHVVYQTDAPVLAVRRRIQGYLDTAWNLLDPEGDDPARLGVVLIGHSLGGVVSRLLCVDSGDVLWSAALTVPPSTLRGDAADVALLDSIFRFQPYPGVSRAIFLAAPHHGTPRADDWLGRVVRHLIGRHIPELEALRRLTQENLDAVRPELRESYLKASVNSIASLRTMQPVRLAAESLLPAAGIPYHTIAGTLPGRHPETDGVVPLTSALLPGAASTLVVESNHQVYESADAVAEVLRILRADLAEQETRSIDALPAPPR